MSPDLFQQKVLDWFDVNGRKDLPWQQNITPYRIWLSEIMLQQTQVTTVVPYFNRFIERFQNVQQLAKAPADNVLHLWAGLGYYARARNLHKTAQLISQQGGEFPNDIDQLMALPGIGRSTAGAILSIAFKNSHPILDGNVRRVLARYHAISGWTGQQKISNKLWDISTRYTPAERSDDYTQAMMDLGATLCTRSTPRCHECPVKSSCLALKTGQVDQLPTPKPKKTLPVKHIVFLILSDHQQQYLLNKRSPSGIWGGLWSFPEFNTPADAQAWCTDNQLAVESIHQLPEQRHTFSHYHLDYTPIVIKTDNLTNNVMEANHSVWYKAEQIKTLGLPAPIKKLLQAQY